MSRAKTNRAMGAPRPGAPIAGERGQTMVEFALVAPVLLLIVFAAIQFGILYNHYVTLTDATRAGARKAVVSRLEPDPAGVAEAQVRRSAGDLDQSELDVAVTAVAWEHAQDVTVEATYPYSVSLLGLVVASGRLKSTTTERVE